jgi:hypothetical protein
MNGGGSVKIYRWLRKLTNRLGEVSSTLKSRLQQQRSLERYHVWRAHFLPEPFSLENQMLQDTVDDASLRWPSLVKLGYRKAILNGHSLQDAISFGLDIEEQLKMVECTKVWEDAIGFAEDSSRTEGTLDIQRLECGLSVMQNIRDGCYPDSQVLQSNLNELAKEVKDTIKLRKLIGGQEDIKTENMSESEIAIRSINHILYLEQEMEAVPYNFSPRKQNNNENFHLNHLLLDTTMAEKRGSGLMIACLYASLLQRVIVSPGFRCHIIALPDASKDCMDGLTTINKFRNFPHNFLLYIEQAADEGTEMEHYVIEPAQNMGPFTKLEEGEFMSALKDAFGEKVCGNGTLLPSISTHEALRFALELLIKEYDKDGSLTANRLHHRFSDLLTALDSLTQQKQDGELEELLKNRIREAAN